MSVDKFIESVARYYSDFLSTDFKKTRLPKRKFQLKDSQDRRIGIALEKFQTFTPQINKKFNAQTKKETNFSVKLGKYNRQLPRILDQGISNIISQLNLKSFNTKNEELLINLKNTLGENTNNLDLELFEEETLTKFRNNISVEIVGNIIDLLAPLFERTRVSEQHALEGLISLNEEITDNLISEFEKQFSGALADLISGNNTTKISELIKETFSSNKIKASLHNYFVDFSSGDLFSELRELIASEKLVENHEFYLYLGELKDKNWNFPIFYIPVDCKLDKDEIKLNIEPRILVNKKAVDFVCREFQDANSTLTASPIENRIIYLNEENIIFDEINKILQPILSALSIDGSLRFGDISNREVYNSQVKVTTNLSFALFDKSDESMLTDYEDMIESLLNNPSLFHFLKNLLGGFLTQNPQSFENQILDEWDEKAIPDRLVFDSPLPLAEEQQKIVSALKEEECKFITVEGPPGTGKSHTISAIAFNAIQDGRSILILSDKKEALDVVENKLDSTLKKVRHKEGFVNPILRLGRRGANFHKILKKATIDDLNTQYREVNKERGKHVTEYNNKFSNLKTSIRQHIEDAKKINLNAILEYQAMLNNFLADEDMSYLENYYYEESNPHYAKKINVLEKLGSIRKLLDEFPTEFQEIIKTNIRNKFENKKFSHLFNEFKKFFEFINQLSELIYKMDQDQNIFKKCPKITNLNYSKLDAYPQKIRGCRGLFGYLFAGKKVTALKIELDEEFGLKSRYSNEDLANFIRSLSKKFDKIYKELEQNFSSYSNIVHSIANLELDNELCDKVKISFNELDELINDELNNLPFNFEEELTPEIIFEILVDKDDEDGKISEIAYGLSLKKEELTELFEFEGYDYLKIKNELELQNSLTLAHQIDKKVIDFANEKKADAKVLSDIIRKKQKFPRDKFDLLIEAFPCMVCSLRDYAEYIPLEKELFDIIVIDEASQVSIAQALPAILRCKKMIVLGDRQQFSNIKTNQASNQLNTAYFSRIIESFSNAYGNETDMMERAKTLNIKSSVLDFIEMITNFNIMLKKHFRGYPEMISFSSKYFYGNSLQAMKVRGKNIDDILEFQHMKNDGLFDKLLNTNELEADYIIKRIEKQLEENDFRSVAVITPFTQQQIFINKKIASHIKSDLIIEKLAFRCFTFDTCQGEERDIIYYSFVANPNRDQLWGIFPRHLSDNDDGELNKNLKMQRLNVGFSRGKEKLVFVHSKPIEQMTSCLKNALNHYKQEIQTAKKLPSIDEIKFESKAEEKVYQWLMQSKYIKNRLSEGNLEIIPQFNVGDYLKALDDNYNHPEYRTDFLLRFEIGSEKLDIILEYDGFEYHFIDLDDVTADNWEAYLRDKDIEREKILESYGYKMLRINKFNIGNDPVKNLEDRIQNLIADFFKDTSTITSKILRETKKSAIGLEDGSRKVCKKCNQTKHKRDFDDPNSKRGFSTYCKDCRPTKITRKRKRRNRRYRY